MGKRLQGWALADPGQIARETGASKGIGCMAGLQAGAEAALIRVTGEKKLQQSKAREAEAHFYKASESGQKQQAESCEHHAATRLASLSRQQNKTTEKRDVLSLLPTRGSPKALTWPT